jgi:hypothetical protein
MKASHILAFGGHMKPAHTRFHRTSTGIEIGGAYTRPPPPPSDDAEKIQAALLLARRAAPKATAAPAKSIAARLARCLHLWSRP